MAFFAGSVNVRIILMIKSAAHAGYSFLKKYWVGLAIFVLPIIFGAVLLGPVLWGGKVFFDSYVVPTQYSLFFSLANALKGGHWFPLWIQQWASGFSLWLLPANAGLLNPVHIILFNFLDFVSAYHLLVLAYLAAGFYAAYFLGRALNLSKAGSLVAALAYGFNAYNVYWAKLLSFSFVYFLLPFLFITAVKAFRGGLKYTFWLTIFIFLAWPFALPQIFIYSLIATLAFALFLDFAKRGDKPFPKQWLATKSYFCFVISGTLLALVWLIPVLNFIQLSTRAGGLSLQSSLRGGTILYGILFHFYIRLFRCLELFPRALFISAFCLLLLPFFLSGISEKTDWSDFFLSAIFLFLP